MIKMDHGVILLIQILVMNIVTFHTVIQGMSKLTKLTALVEMIQRELSIRVLSVIIWDRTVVNINANLGKSFFLIDQCIINKQVRLSCTVSDFI